MGIIQLCASWMLGSMVTSLILWVTSFFFRICSLHVIVIMIFQFFISFKIRFGKTFPKRKFFSYSSFEATISLYLCLLLVSFVSLAYLIKLFRDYPEKMPTVGLSLIEYENTMIQSILYGVNAPRKSFLCFSDPFVSNLCITSSSLPYIFQSCLCVLGASFESSSSIIAFFNILSTAMAIYYFSSSYSSRNISISLMFLFNSSWSILIYYFNENGSPEVIHGTGRLKYTPWHQIMAVYLVFSKELSFSIPMTIFAMAIAQISTKKRIARLYILSGIIGCLIPNFLMSMAFFATSSCYISSAKYVLPFSLLSLIKLKYSPVEFNPIWREYQFQGIYFSEIIVWFDCMGPIFLFLLFIPFYLKDQLLLHRFINGVSAMLFLSLFREGKDTINTSASITAISFPILITAFIESFERMKNKCSNDYINGVIAFFELFMNFIVVCGGILILLRVSSDMTKGIDNDDSNISLFIKDNVHFNEKILTDSLPMNPVYFLLGRQVFYGSSKNTWKRGSKIYHHADQYYEMLNSELYQNVMKRNRLKFVLQSKKHPLFVKNASNFSEMYHNKKWVVYRLND